MLVGITGGMGSGKSALAMILVEFGARRVDADAVAREVADIPEVVGKLVQAFGRDILDAQGQLDRRELGRRAFKTQEGGRILEEIMRPPLAEAIERHLVEAESDEGEGIVVYDAPLIYEWGTEGRYDKVVVVDADEANCVNRVMRRTGMEEGEIRERMQLQMDPAEKKARADYIVDNNGDLEALRKGAKDLWAKLQRDR